MWCSLQSTRLHGDKTHVDLDKGCRYRRAEAEAEAEHNGSHSYHHIASEKCGVYTSVNSGLVHYLP
jgi:hypothetical protein